MPFGNKVDVRCFIGRAASLPDRTSGAYVAYLNGRETSDRARQRLHRWQAVAGAGDTEMFSQRLASLGLNSASALPLLGDVALRENASVPGWFKTFEEIVEALGSTGLGSVPHPAVRAEQPLPFEQLFTPILKIAQNRVRQRTANQSRVSIGERGWLSMQHALLERLTTVASSSLLLEFSVFRTQAASTLSVLVSSTWSSRRQYDRFTHSFAKGGGKEFFWRYPVIARLLSLIVDQWVESTVELLERLDRDLDGISPLIGTPSSTAKVDNLVFGLSDPHCGGRTVAVIIFADGAKVVYKPRELAIEIAFGKFAEYLTAVMHCANGSLRIPRVIDCGLYGWVEHISQRVPSGRGECEEYSFNAGRMLALFYLLEATDMHHENVIANRGTPVPIDLETVLHARPWAWQGMRGDAQAKAVFQLWQSVLRTMFLPQWMVGPRGMPIMVGGMHGHPESRILRESGHVWSNINSDNMTLVSARAEAEGANLSDATFDLDAEEIIRGFQDTCRFLRQEGDALPKAREVFAGQRVRFILRPTHVYRDLLHSCLRPDLLTDGADFSIELEVLGSHSTEAEDAHLLSSELSALESLDVPRFTACTDSKSVRLENGEVVALFDESPLEVLAENFRRLSDDDIQCQCAFIRAGLQASAALGPRTLELGTSSGQVIDDCGRPPNIDLARAVSVIADHIRTLSVQDRSGARSWIGLQPIVGTERYQLQVLDAFLYNGVSGLALFLAAAGKCEQNSSFSQAARDAFEPLAAEMRDNPQRALRAFGLGGFCGGSSVIYSLLSAGQLLDDNSLVEAAARGVEAIDQGMISNARFDDVVFGLAGAILTILTFNRRHPVGSALTAARVCGQRLCERAISVGPSAVGWRDVYGTVSTGFSHGSAGIGFALLRLFQATGEERFRRTAEEALNGIQLALQNDVRNWSRVIATTQGAQPECGFGWCHGAPGIALFLSVACDVISSPSSHQDFDVARQRLLSLGRGSVDHLCCGTLGRSLIALKLCDGGNIELALLLKGHAMRMATEVFTAAQREGGYRLIPNLPRGVASLGLMQGLAGIGYAFLKLRDRGQELPDILQLS